MTRTLDFADSWVPSLVEPGSVLVMTNASDDPGAERSMCAIVCCPSCGSLQLIPQPRAEEGEPVRCGVTGCTAHLRLSLPEDDAPVV